MRFTVSTRAALLSSLVIAAACRTTDGGPETGASQMKGDEPAANAQAAASPQAAEGSAIDFYENFRIQDLQAEKSCDGFVAQQGIAVTKRDEQGNAVEGTVRTLVDNPNQQIYIIGDWNDWGDSKTDDDKLRAVDGTPYYEGRVRKLKHKMSYRFLVNGKQLLDMASPEFTPEGTAKLHSVFWDFEHPGHYAMQTKSVDLRKKMLMIGESEIYELAKKWKKGAQTGPDKVGNTYEYIATSGLIDELKKIGYNAVELLPFNQSRDSQDWRKRYQVYGLYAPESRYGDPDDFAKMIDSFNKAGIAVIMDSVVSHYPFNANDGGRDLNKLGAHNWKRKDGKQLYGDRKTEWSTYRYDYNSTSVRRFLADSVLHMMCKYGITGIRFDNLDGIKDYQGGGGVDLLKQLAKEVREYRPETILIGEMFFGNNNVMKRMDQGGWGFNYRTHSNFFDFLKDNMQKPTEQVDIERVKKAIRDPWDWKEASRVQYVTNHDEAANKRDGATGNYVATLLNGGNWYYVEKKTMAFGSLTMLSASAYMDMPQMRLLQEGSFNDNPAVEWELRKKESQSQIYQYFADLSNLVKDRSAFAFLNFHGNIENHVDTFAGWRVISFYRRDPNGGKKVYAVVNLGHVGVSNYKFGVDATGDFKVLIDSDDKKYGGTGELKKRLPGMVVTAEGQGLHGKDHRITLPYLAPYASVLLEAN